MTRAFRSTLPAKLADQKNLSVYQDSRRFNMARIGPMTHRMSTQAALRRAHGVRVSGRVIEAAFKKTPKRTESYLASKLDTDTDVDIVPVGFAVL